MARTALVSLGLATLLVAAPVTLLAQADPATPPSAPQPEVMPPDTVVPPSDTPPAGAVTPPITPAPETPAASPPAAATTPPAATPEAPAPAAAPAPAKAPPQLSPFTTRLLMDVVTGVAGAGVVLALGFGLATPLALLPWALPAALTTRTVVGVPVSLLVTGGLVAVVLAGAVALSAVVQRLVRPLLGTQPSFLGAILGAVFFGGVGAALGLVTAFLAVTVPPDPARGMRDQVFGSITGSDPRALALTGALVVGLAVPFAALGAGIGGPISAEREDLKAVEGSVE